MQLRQTAMPRLLLLVLCLLAASARADCSADAAQPRPRLVELYTSEGCSSCPPADAWLRRAAPGRVAALEFHVDYWDSLGWRDRFSDARFTARQQTQAAREGSGSVYTPQLVLDGSSWPGWYHDALPDTIAARATMRVSLATGAALRVHVETQLAETAGAAAYRNFVALTEDGLSSQVRAGENRGTLLRHDHVVRAFAGPLPLAAADAELRLPAGFDPAHARVIAFAQRPADGSVAQVVVCGL
jgi:hypothetical protein